MPSSLTLRLGPYEIVRRLGASATTEVVAAVERGPFGFQRKVTLKRVLAGLPVEERALAIADLAAEARAYTRVAHPALARLYELFADDGLPIIVMEHVEGISLARMLLHARARGERLDTELALYAGYVIFLALEAAHAARDPITAEHVPLVHRAVCPANVIVQWDGTIKLVDLGMTDAYAYVAPEQLRGEPASVRGDVYSACLVLRELLLGVRAFPTGERTRAELLAAMANPAFIPLSVLLPRLSPAVSEAVDRGLARDHARRTITAEQLARVLRSKVDLDLGRRLWADRIAEVRPVEQALEQSLTAAAWELRSRSKLVVETPTAMTSDPGEAPSPRRSFFVRAVAAGFAVGMLLGIGFATQQRLAAKAARAARAPAASERVDAAPPPPVAPSASALAVPSATATDSLRLIPPKAKDAGRRR